MLPITSHPISCIFAVSQFSYFFVWVCDFSLSIPRTHSHTNIVCSPVAVYALLKSARSVCLCALCTVPLERWWITINFFSSNKKFNFNYACTDQGLCSITHRDRDKDQHRIETETSGTCLSLQQFHKHFILIKWNFFSLWFLLSLSLLRPIFPFFALLLKHFFCFADGFIRLHADCSRLWVFRLIYENAKKHHDNSFASNNVAPAVKKRKKTQKWKALSTFG